MNQFRKIALLICALALMVMVPASSAGPASDNKELMILFTHDLHSYFLPHRFAKLMSSMWPQLIDAMPFGMGPELMPKVMDSLMPHMIGDVVPLVTQQMIDYLTGKTKYVT